MFEREFFRFRLCDCTFRTFQGEYFPKKITRFYLYKFQNGRNENDAEEWQSIFLKKINF